MINRLLIAGNPLPFHVGAHFMQAAESLGIHAHIHDTRQAFHDNRYLQAIYWRLLGKRPARMGQYGRALLKQCKEASSELLLAIGKAPLDASSLKEIGKMGIIRAIFLTDDPFNPAHNTNWFRQALLEYDYIFTPRRANLADLKAVTDAHVSYLPFAYNPAVHFPDSIPAQNAQMGSDMLFAGGADSARLPYMEAFISAGLSIDLYGGYWEKHASTSRYSRGHASLATLRNLIPTTKINLGLVRQANRDGHVMRSFEVPAMRGLLLAEDTAEHRDLFGSEGELVLYFDSPTQALEQAQWLLARPAERKRLATAVYRHITGHDHTYAHRLQTILDVLT